MEVFINFRFNVLVIFTVGILFYTSSQSSHIRLKDQNFLRVYVAFIRGFLC